MSKNNWQLVKISDVCEVIMGQSPPGYTYNKEGKGMPFFQGKTDFGELFPTVSTWCTAPQKIVEPKDILISVRAPVGPSNICLIKSCIGRGLSALRCKDRLNYKYLFYYLCSTEKQIERLGTGSTFSAISKSEIRNLPIPLPPLPEQQKIAEILSAVDEAIQKTAEIIAKTQELKKGLMQQLLTKGIGHTKFKQTEIGEIPEEWGVVKLGDEKITRLIKSGGTPLKQVKEYYQEGDILFVKIGDMTKSEKFLYDTEVKITKWGLENSSALSVPENSILFSMYGTMGKVLINKVSVAISQNIASITPQSEINVEYLFYSLNQVTPQIYRSLKTITLKHLDIKIIKDLKVPLPPLPEQQKIAEILSAVDEKIEAERKKKEKLEQLKKGLMQDLLTGKVRVKVN